MVRDCQRDVESSEEGAFLTGQRRGAASATVAQPAALSPLPLLLLGAVILVICLVAVDTIWELPLEQRQRGPAGPPHQIHGTHNLVSAIKNGLSRPLHAAAHGRPAASGLKPASERGSSLGQAPRASATNPQPVSTGTLAASQTPSQPPPTVTRSPPALTPPLQPPSPAGEQAGPLLSPLPVSQRKIRVVPTHRCQAVTLQLEAHCVAGGAKAHDEDPKCKAAYAGQYSSSYLAPFVAIAKAMRHDFGFINYQVEASMSGLGGEAEIASGAWTNASLADADIIIVEEGEAHNLMLRHPGKKFIVVQQPAHATLAAIMESYGTCARNLLEDERVLAYLQHSSLQPLTLNNLPRISKSVHYFVLNSTFQGHTPFQEIMQAPFSEPPLFIDALLKKVYTLMPLVWRWRHPVGCHGSPSYLDWMTPSLALPPGSFPDWLPPLNRRQVDVAFTGARIPGPWHKNAVTGSLYEQHRAALYAALKKFKAAHPELQVEIPDKLEYSEFAQLLRRTKLFISPWGFGEYSGKDLETAISRTVLVKPLASMITAYPPIYEPNRTCIEVAVDFSDLESVVLSALADLPSLQQVADEAYRRLVDSSRESTVARDVAAMLHEVIV